MYTVRIETRAAYSGTIVMVEHHPSLECAIDTIESLDGFLDSGDTATITNQANGRVFKLVKK